MKSIPHEHAVELATFSPDGRTLLTGCSNGQITFTDTDSAREIFTADSSPDIRAGAIHPSGKHAVVYGSNGICLYDLATRTFQIRLVHGPHDPFILLEPIMAQVLRKFERRARKGWPNADEQVRELRQSRQRVLDAHQGKPLPIARQSTEQMFAMTFNPEGTLLACANTGGLRVYDWDELLSSRYQTPPPRYAIDAEESPDEADAAIGHAFTYDVHFDKSAQSILSCGREGTIKSLDLATGSSRVILRPPQLGPLWRINLSSDDSLLALAYQPVFFERSPKTKWLFQLWNYPKLA
jgi:WD40 repeat protein